MDGQMHAGSNPWGSILGQLLGLHLMRPELRRVRQEREEAATRASEEQEREDLQRSRLEQALNAILGGLGGGALPPTAAPQPAAPPTLPQYSLGQRPTAGPGPLAQPVAPLAAPTPRPAPAPPAAGGTPYIGSPEFAQHVLQYALAGGDPTRLINAANLMPEPEAAPIGLPKLAQEALGQKTVTPELARLLPSLAGSGMLTKPRAEAPEATPTEEAAARSAALNFILPQLYPEQPDLNIGNATPEQLATALYLVTGKGREAAEIPTIGPEATADLAQTAARTEQIKAQTTQTRSDTARISRELDNARDPSTMTDAQIQAEHNVLADNEATLLLRITTLMAPVLDVRGRPTTPEMTPERQTVLDRAQAALRRIDQRRRELGAIAGGNLARRHGM